jgi:phage baseplate assembly protein V
MNISIFDLKRVVTKLQNKIYRVIGKAILVALDNSGTVQKIQASVLKNETSSNLERSQEYGFDSYPKAGAQVVLLAIGGNRDHAIAFSVSDRRYRPTDLAEGEVAVYSFKDKTLTNKHRVHLKANGDIEIKCETANITATTAVNIDGGTGSLTGIVNQASLCAFTGLVHPDGSTNCKCSK